MDNQATPSKIFKVFGKIYNFHDTFTGPNDEQLAKTIANYNNAGHKTLIRKNKANPEFSDLYVRQDNTKNQ